MDLLVKRIAGALTALALVTSAGCKGNPVGEFRGDAFYAARGHYRVRTEAEGSLLPPEWRLTNWSNGSISGARRLWPRLRFERRDGTVWRSRVELFDLRFSHARDDSVLWVRTVPLGWNASHTELEILARDYVDRAASGSAATVDFTDHGPTVRTRRFGPRVIREGPAEVAGLPAYFVTFEHVDLDRQEADPSSRGDFVTVVLMRPGEHVWRTRVITGQRAPMVLILGYATRPERHAEHRSAFEEFVGRIDIAPSS